MQPISLRARVVVPLAGPPIDGGVVTIAGERIEDVGARPPAGAAATLDLGDVALLPGLVNAHTHLEFSDLARPLGTPGMRLADWIRLVIARRSQHASDVQAAVVAGLGESLRHGVTTVCDITTSDLGIYAGLPRGPDVISLLEVIGFSKARAVSALAAAEDRLRESKRTITSQPAPGRLAVGLSPHAPYTVGPHLLRELVGLAHRDRLPVAMHLAESRDELELFQTGTGPFRELLEERSMWDDQSLSRWMQPLEYLLLLRQAPRCLVVHGTHLSGLELHVLRNNRERMTLVYCPRTDAYFNRDRYPLAAALKAGVRVALGTDSRASSPDLSVLAEIRHAADAHPEVRPAQILRMATLDAAEGLGIAGEVGSIAPGKLANLTAVPIDVVGRDSPADAVVHSDKGPVATWYRGVEMTNAEIRMPIG